MDFFSPNYTIYVQNEVTGSTIYDNQHMERIKCSKNVILIIGILKKYKFAEKI